MLLNFIFDTSVDFIPLKKHIPNMEFIAHSTSRKCVIVQDGLNVKESCLGFAFQMLTSIWQCSVKLLNRSINKSSDSILDFNSQYKPTL